MMSLEEELLIKQLIKILDLYKDLEKKAKIKNKTIIFPESYDERVIKAVETILNKKLAKVILIQDKKNLDLPAFKDKNLTVVDINSKSQFIEEYHKIKIKRTPAYKISQSKKDLNDPLTFSCMLLKNNFADGIIAGAVYSTTTVLRNAISIIGLLNNNETVSSFFLFSFPDNNIHNKRILAFADCGVIPLPTIQQLSDIALQTSSNFAKLTGLKPRVAFLSFSTKGSSFDLSLNKLIQAYTLTRKRDPALICDGELQFDTAFVPSIGQRKNPDGEIKGDANVFIFPDLNSGNIAYKITERLGGAIATGPVIQGLQKPVMDLSRGCSEKDIINMTSVITNIT